MHPAFIKAELERSGTSITTIARQLDCSASAVSQVIYGYSRSRAVESRIAVQIGKPLHEIWPQWYDRRGKRLEGRRRRAVSASEAISAAQAVFG